MKWKIRWSRLINNLTKDRWIYYKILPIYDQPGIEKGSLRGRLDEYRKFNTGLNLIIWKSLI